MQIGNKEVGGDSRCFIVAEAGLAHGGNKDLAFKLIDLAVDAGADAVKFQVYKASELVDYKRDPALFERFKSKELSYDVFKELQEYAKIKGIIWFATAHTESALEFLVSLGVPCYKIGSGEKGSDLFGKIIDLGKPTFISTGMRTHSEVVNLVTEYYLPNVVFLHCVTMYPVHPHHANLGFLNSLRSMGVRYGYSCHMPGTQGVEVAVSLGAKVVEKHIKLPESMGQDTLCALFKDEFGMMVKKIRLIERVLGSNMRVYSAEEKENEKWALKGKDGKRPI
jgi:N-acetylneuraminate synthase/N,N'-diacetyllegionaminate synthase